MSDGYVFIASTLPVTTLLQPRDFINSHQLVVAMTVLTLSVVVASFSTNLQLVAPAVQLHPPEAPSMWPFLFITIACGAISGFHNLVSSGTTSKQLEKESDALFVGYGSMLMEGVLATLVIVAVAAGIGLGYKGYTGAEAWQYHYSSWTAAQGLGSKISAFVVGAANLIPEPGIPRFISITIMGVFVASFASTTLDSATRIQRYVVTEIFSNLGIDLFKNRYVATLFAVVTGSLLAFATGADGAGALSLWPLFGVVNQVLAALGLIVITLYLKKQGGLKWLVSGIPMIIMLIISFYAGIASEFQYIEKSQTLLAIINAVVICIMFWIVIEGFIQFFETECIDEYYEAVQTQTCLDTTTGPGLL